VDKLLLIARILSFAGGCVICYAALFLYETETREVQNTLEEWWIRVDDLRTAAVKRHVALLRVSAQATEAILDRTFGQRLISLHAISVSGILSLVSLFLCTRWLELHGMDIGIAWLRHTGRKGLIGLPEFIILLVTVMSALILSAMPEHMGLLSAAAVCAIVVTTMRPHLRFLSLWVFLLVVSIFLVPIIVPVIHDVAKGTPDIVLIAAMLGVFTDIVTIICIRRVLRWQVQHTRTSSVIVATVAQASIAIALIVVPLAFGFISVLHSYPEASFNAVAVAWSATTNGLCFLIALSLFVVLLAFLVHVLIWPLIQRPLYQLASLGIFRTPTTRAALFAVGAALLLLATDTAGSVITPLLKLLGAA